MKPALTKMEKAFLKAMGSKMQRKEAPGPDDTVVDWDEMFLLDEEVYTVSGPPQ